MVNTPLESKSKNSILNAISSILYTGINGLLTLIVTRLIIVYYGSDYNGLTTTANQLVSILLVLESGFTIASNVALFTPMAQKDYNLVSRIISTTKKSFIIIGIAYLLVGSIVALAYSSVIESDIPRLEVFLVLIISLLPTSLNFIFATKYTVLFQSSQHEYILNTIKILATFIGQGLVILIVGYGIDRVTLRIIMMVSPVVAVVLTILAGKKSYDYLDYNKKADISLIPGTKDLLVQKFVGLLYSAAPTLIMSVRIGTIAISVFGIYNNVIILMRSIANAFMNSPRMSLGALIAENNLDHTRAVFKEYENIVFAIASIMTICYFSLIMPFVSIYTRGINDASYIQDVIAILMGIVFYVECVHIPSGIFLNMAGIFKVSKNIQTIATIILGVSIIVALWIGSISAFVISILLSAVALAIMEIGYVHFRVVMLDSSMDWHSMIDLLLYSLITLILSVIGYSIDIDCDTYFGLLIRAIIVFLLSCILVYVFLAIYNRPLIKKYTYYLKLKKR